MTVAGIVLTLVLVVAWLTAAATSVRTVSRIWLRHWAERRLAGGESSPTVERPQRLLIAASTGIASTVFALGALLALNDDGLDLVRTLVFAAIALLVGGQLVPRAIARRFSTPLVAALTPALSVLEWASRPLIRIASALPKPFMAPSQAPDDPREALEDLLREGELEGVGAPAESAIISGVVDFSEKAVAEVMTLRTDIVAVERSLGAAEVIRTVAQSKYSRIPVYDKDLDHVVGLIHSFDVLARPAAPVSVLRRVVVVRQAERCDSLMRRMMRERVHLAIIQDDAAQTLGLVTLEDLVEELVGDIHDEHDDLPLISPPPAN
ncbi:MAG: CNNM domain-containing protein [Gemmatimonadetes bacterium]|nr:CNNM domain-containing protein [Gemmatimonadota bacterium]